MRKLCTCLFYGLCVFTIVFSLFCVAWVYPVVMILLNSLKKESAISTSTVFQLPSAESFAGLSNYVNAVGSKGFVGAFFTSLLITVTSVAAAKGAAVESGALLCTIG